MAVSYNRLWKLLIDKKMSKADLRKAAGLAPNTMTKLRRDEPVECKFVFPHIMPVREECHPIGYVYGVHRIVYCSELKAQGIGLVGSGSYGEIYARIAFIDKGGVSGDVKRHLLACGQYVHGHGTVLRNLLRQVDGCLRPCKVS